MKQLLLMGCLVLLSACQLTSNRQEPLAEPTITSGLSEDEPVVHPADEVAASLQFSADAATLQAWLEYKQLVLADPETALQRLQTFEQLDELQQFQLALIRLHPENAYISRFRVQAMLTEWLQQLPVPLMAMFSWELSFNQKLLEAESAVSALTRLNAQQQQQLDRLQKTNRELQKKIEALTQIEAELNQQPLDTGIGAGYGQG